MEKERVYDLEDMSKILVIAKFELINTSLSTKLAKSLLKLLLEKSRSKPKITEQEARKLIDLRKKESEANTSNRDK
jgi:hypothetical protein